MRIYEDLGIYGGVLAIYVVLRFRGGVLGFWPFIVGFLRIYGEVLDDLW